MLVIVNGERTEITATDLRGLLGELDYPGTQVAIAVNYQVVPRARWGETALNSGDQIEIITPRQGG
jgi:sulfur carrier protein